MTEAAWKTFMTSVKTSIEPKDNPLKTDSKTPTDAWKNLFGGGAAFPTSG